MALTRAQLLAGNSSQGVVLPGQVQGVTAGAGVTIDATGTLSLNGNDPAFNGFVKTNNASAFNAFVWPATDGNSGQQLTTNGAGILSWSDADGIPWDAKGQLVAGTGVGTQTLLDVGANTAVLLADSSTTSGLAYSDSVTTAIQIPAGSSLQQPSAPVVGQIRYNTDDNRFEGYLGSPPAWSPIGGIFSWTSPGELIVGTGVETDAILAAGADTSFLVADSANAPYGLSYTDTVNTAALLPAGTTAERPGTPANGQIRFNTDNAAYEAYGQNSTAWEALGATGASTDKIVYFNEQTVTTDYAFPAAPIIKNGLSAGPITIDAGVTVTVPAGQAWSIV